MYYPRFHFQKSSYWKCNFYNHFFPRFKIGIIWSSQKFFLLVQPQTYVLSVICSIFYNRGLFSLAECHNTVFKDTSQMQDQKKFSPHCSSLISLELTHLIQLSMNREGDLQMASCVFINIFSPEIGEMYLQHLVRLSGT